MTIKQAFKRRSIEYPEEYKPTYDINFVNNENIMDETQFTVNSLTTAVEELNELFKDFCIENGFKRNQVVSITSVKFN